MNNYSYMIFGAIFIGFSAFIIRKILLDIKNKKLHVSPENSYNIKYLEINSRIENFLANVKYVKSIAKFKNESIYQYIYNKKTGHLYEFFEIMPESNNKIGVDDNFLCFKQLTYKRVTDLSIISSISSEIN